MNTILIGAQGEAKVISELTNRGWGVGKPILDLGVDLLAYKIEKNTIRLVAIQVKTLEMQSHHHGTCFGIQFNREDVIDGVFYIIVCLGINEFVIIPSEEMKRKSHWHQNNEEWKNLKNRWDLIK